ncbi:hypothetical protein GALMADRAFT_138128 [Galerina marginata CBS 339.88]|uniref:Uncharacterized protein n=1 Tax=Galerina marginata (strain CBS 339.88) TaxID=685588 RepID=A0A067TGA2_GALM3|nr:hypothetical protein GALMADRAFT_138128 [Galerina marginata CBS 339.88]
MHSFNRLSASFTLVISFLSFSVSVLASPTPNPQGQLQVEVTGSRPTETDPDIQNLLSNWLYGTVDPGMVGRPMAPTSQFRTSQRTHRLKSDSDGSPDLGSNIIAARQFGGFFGPGPVILPPEMLPQPTQQVGRLGRRPRSTIMPQSAPKAVILPRASEGGVLTPQDWLLDASAQDNNGPREFQSAEELDDRNLELQLKRASEMEGWKGRHRWHHWHHHRKRDNEYSPLNDGNLAKRWVGEDKSLRRELTQRDNEGNVLKPQDWFTDVTHLRLPKRETETEDWKWKHHLHKWHHRDVLDDLKVEYLLKREISAADWKHRNRHHRHGKRADSGLDGSNDAEEPLPEDAYGQFGYHRRSNEVLWPQAWSVDISTLQKRAASRDWDIFSNRFPRDAEHWRHWHHWHHHRRHGFPRDEIRENNPNEDEKAHKTKKGAEEGLEGAAHVVDTGVKGTLGSFLGFGF